MDADEPPAVEASQFPGLFRSSAGRTIARCSEFEYGRIAFEMKRIGHPIGQNDITIAARAFALEWFTFGLRTRR